MNSGYYDSFDYMTFESVCTNLQGCYVKLIGAISEIKVILDDRGRKIGQIRANITLAKKEINLRPFGPKV